MGIFGALTTAVTGLRAQSFALENISGNIANSQTTAFKREDTSFLDLIPDNPPSKQLSGTVTASARATNTVQGDFQSASIGTFMAINGGGFFVVQKPSSFTDGRPTFAGSDLYTRRGDFQTDKDGFLVNGAGYYLMGIPVDAKTGNLSGSVPQLLKFQNDFLPAQQTTQIQYRANLAAYPATTAHDTSVPGSELIDPKTFSANPVAGSPAPAKITGFGATLAGDADALVTGLQVVPASMVNTGSFTLNGATVNVAAGMTQAQLLNAINTSNAGGLPAGMKPAVINPSGHLVLESADADTQIAISGSSPALLAELGIGVGNTDPTNLLTQSAAAQGQTMVIQVGANPALTVTFGTGASEVSTMAELQAKLGTLTGGTANVDISNGNIKIGANTLAATIQVTGTATASNFGIHTLTALPSNQQVLGMDTSAFISETIGGGAITAYDQSGSPVNLQLRWGKVDSASLGAGHADNWNLFYQVNSSATGTQVAWQNAGVNYTFDPNGQMNPLIANTTLNNVSVNGIALGTLQIVHGSGGLTQFSDTNGTAQVNLIQQDGFPAGSLQTISISDKGRVVGTYSNGRTLDLAEVTLANFNGPNQLKRLDGGAFAVTDDSGPAILGAPGKIVGSSLEGSNVDIADEFTKLIVTQQAYSANTRVVTTSNQMVQDVLNMLR
ncbi:MAG TPA: flagellar hook-basal body complex protein [Gemmatimonadaceae bacterium]|nr:flagellar hook-basal body complex protein [Gemmatimonadaceae bacterium]